MCSSWPQISSPVMVDAGWDKEYIVVMDTRIANVVNAAYALRRWVRCLVKFWIICFTVFCIRHTSFPIW